MRAGVRAQLLATSTSKLTIRLIADYSNEDDTCCTSATTARTLHAHAALG